MTCVDVLACMGGCQAVDFVILEGMFGWDENREDEK